MFMLMFFVVDMCFGSRQSDKHGRKDGEYVCLDVRYQQFETIHKDGQKH